MIFTALIGLKDPLRARVQKVVKYASKGGINVRLISGDHIDTVKAAAIDAGILDQAEIEGISIE